MSSVPKKADKLNPSLQYINIGDTTVLLSAMDDEIKD